MDDRSGDADSEVREFYDAWAVDYDAAHADWQAAVRLHGRVLGDALVGAGVAPGAKTLDCTCGIGTQAIGLALEGYTVFASDLSPAEVERARHEAGRFGVRIELTVADLLDLRRSLPAGWDGFDAVVSASSLTHMADEEQLVDALTNMASVCRAGGAVVVSNRDYDAIADVRPSSTPVQQSIVDGVRRVSFQLWDWAADGRSYRMEDVLMVNAIDRDHDWSTRSRATTLYAWQRADVERAAAAAGLVDARWTQHDWQPVATFRV